jgi:hypothetical protein
MKLDKVSTYLESETLSATFNLPSATVTIKKKETVAGCGVAGCGVRGIRLRISDCGFRIEKTLMTEFEVRGTS